MPKLSFSQFILPAIISIYVALIILQDVAGAPGPTTKCASRCKCNETAIRCTEMQITKVPDFRKVTTHPRILDVSSNDIEEITTTTFFSQSLTGVEELSLGDNSIFSIEVGAFSSLSNLKRLDLSNNLLDELPSQVIRNNEKLTELNLSGNLFNTKTPQLVSTSLQILDLSFCKITSLEEDHLKSLPELTTLRLQANSLSHVDYNIFEEVKLNHIDLSYNTWKCNCDTIKLFSYLVEAKLTKIVKPIQCMHSNKWYEEIFSSSGPMHQNKLCSKKLHRVQAAKNATTNSADHEVTKEELDNFEYVVQYEIVFAAAVIICVFLVVALASLFVIIRKYESRKPLYSEVNPTFG